MVSTLPGPHDYRSVWRLSRLLIMWELLSSSERPPSGNYLVEEGNSHRITVSPCSCSLPALLEGHNPSMGVKYMPLRVPALWPSHFSFPQGEMLDLFRILFFCLAFFALSRFLDSAKSGSRPLPFCKIGKIGRPPFTVRQDLKRPGCKASKMFGSNTPWEQGPAKNTPPSS